MNKILLLFFVLISGLFNPLKACEDMTFSIDFDGEADIPETVNYILDDGNEWAEGVITIAGESNFPFVLCVEADCFALTIYTEEGLSGVEAINVETDQGEFYSELYPTDLGYSIEGCIENINECPEEPLYIGSECLTGIFEIGSFVEGEEVAWNFGDGTFETGGHFTTHDYEQPGTYQVCGYYTSPNCEGAEYCGEVVIEGCGSTCDLEIEVFEQVDCGAYHCGIFDENINSFDWYLDGELYWEDGNYMVVYLEELGEHNLCAVYSNEECGEVETCITLTAEGCVESCTEVQFGLLNLSEDITSVDWSLSGPGIVLAEGTAEYDGFGTEWIDLCIEEGCYYFEVNSAEGLLSDETFSLSMQGISGMVELTGTGSGSEYIGFELCVGPTLVYPEEECPTTIWTNGACDVTAFEIGSFQEGEVAIWNFGDGTIETGGHYIEHVYEEAGTYQICVEYSSNSCEGVEACTSLYIDPCVECPSEITVESTTDCFSVFTLEQANPDSSVFWYVDEVYMGESFGSFEVLLDEPGWHTVCADYSFVGCWDIVCTDFFVQDCSEGCPTDIDFYIDPNCFAFFDLIGGENLGTTYWYIDDEEVAVGAPYYSEFITEPGWHNVCATYSSPDCEVFEMCTEFFVDGCGEDCDADLAILGTDGCVSEIRVQGIPVDVAVGWTFNDVSFINTDNYWFSYEYPGNGWYTICATFYTEECGETTLCEEVYIEGCTNNECYLDGFLEEFGCGQFMLKLYGENQNDVFPDVYIDGVYYDSGWGVEMILEPGEHVICGVLPPTETCNELEFCLDAVAEDCDCPTEIDISTNDCITIFELDETGSEVNYIIQGDNYQESFFGQGNIFTWEAPENGEYQVCAFFTSENCAGDSICDAFFIDGCNLTESCTMELEYTTGEEGYYLFEASNNQDASIQWFVNGDYIESGNAFDWTFDEPGAYEVCASFESENCPEGIISCVNIIVPEDDNCTEVTITIDVEGDLLEDFDIAYELEGLDFPFGGDFTIYENCGSTVITFCVPDGCYEMTMSLEEFLEAAIILEMFVDGGVEYDYTIDPLTQTVTMEFGINTDCTTGVIETTAQEFEVYPIPSSSLINVKHSLSNATWRIFDAQGRVVDQGVTNGNQIMVLDIQSYATGTYVIQLIGADTTLQKRFQKVE